jgi:hypothetical protein
MCALTYAHMHACAYGLGQILFDLTDYAMFAELGDENTKARCLMPPRTETHPLNQQSDLEPNTSEEVSCANAEIPFDDQRLYDCGETTGDKGRLSKKRSVSDFSVSDHVSSNPQKRPTSSSCSVSEFSWPLGNSCSVSEFSPADGDNGFQQFRSRNDSPCVSEHSQAVSRAQGVPQFSPGNHEINGQQRTSMSSSRSACEIWVAGGENNNQQCMTLPISSGASNVLQFAHNSNVLQSLRVQPPSYSSVTQSPQIDHGNDLQSRPASTCQRYVEGLRQDTLGSRAQQCIPPSVDRSSSQILQDSFQGSEQISSHQHSSAVLSGEHHIRGSEQQTSNTIHGAVEFMNDRQNVSSQQSRPSVSGCRGLSDLHVGRQSYSSVFYRSQGRATTSLESAADLRQPSTPSGCNQRTARRPMDVTRGVSNEQTSLNPAGASDNGKCSSRG